MLGISQKEFKKIQESRDSLDEYLKQKIHQQMVMNSSDDPSSSKPYSKDTKENLPNKESEDTAKKPTRKRRSSSTKPCSNGHFCTCGLSEDDAYKVNTILKKKNLHFMLGLTMFHYEIREKQTPSPEEEHSSSSANTMGAATPSSKGAGTYLTIDGCTTTSSRSCAENVENGLLREEI
eukprot:CAMPEP_0196995222 /NCGR_PEP_ID=MMETSP1380-20130617/1384_1 /TAXON_ID=5936 /ORGANISM="Euplotes crassus, Strain CT5" /LENGTH=177 /DNA_ID=CAMNT_0042410839 /DNA_START=295 /DNA_END=829 /DNA_ORIENTATION=+